MCNASGLKKACGPEFNISVINREKDRKQDWGCTCVCTASYRCERVLAGVCPDRGGVQSLYRLAPCHCSRDDRKKRKKKPTCRNVPLVGGR